MRGTKFKEKGPDQQFQTLNNSMLPSSVNGRPVKMKTTKVKLNLFKMFT